MNAASAPMSASKPCPSSASAAIWRSSPTAWRSSSARRFTTAPIKLRSSCADSMPCTARHGSPFCSAACASSARTFDSVTLGCSSPRSKMPVLPCSARYSTRSVRDCASGAAAVSNASGISARSPDSMPSNAGNRMRMTRTQVTVRAIDSSRTSASGTAFGSSVCTSSRNDAITPPLLTADV